MPTLNDLQALGQSIWLDFIRRGYLLDGSMQAWIDRGVRGVTSNPSIFEKAIVDSDDYDDQITRLVGEGSDLKQIYEALVVADIQQACDLFRPVHEGSDGLDGYISLEVSPELADDTQGTIEEVLHFHGAVDRPNLMIKIPATPAGYPAIEAMLGQGININITLMFSWKQYEAVAEAYLRGVEKFAAAGGDPGKLASVASFFVSRVDSKLDPMLADRGHHELLGKIGVANAKLAYQRFKQRFSGDRWRALEAAGARPQRVLWGSTSTKNPDYPDTMYVDELIGPHTVNTAPPATIEAFIDHGEARLSLEHDIAGAERQIEALEATGISLEDTTDSLLAEGLKSFSNAFEGLMAGLASKSEALKSQPASGD